MYIFILSDEFSTLDDKEDFFKVLGGGSPDKVPDESAAEEDAAFETKDAAAVTLYKVTDSAGTLKVETISTKPIRQEMLKSEVSHLMVDFINEIRAKQLFNFFVGLLHFGHWICFVCMGWTWSYSTREISIYCASTK